MALRGRAAAEANRVRQVVARRVILPSLERTLEGLDELQGHTTHIMQEPLSASRATLIELVSGLMAIVTLVALGAYAYGMLGFLTSMWAALLCAALRTASAGRTSKARAELLRLQYDIIRDGQ